MPLLLLGINAFY